MANAAAVRALEADCPWLRQDFQDDLATLQESTSDAARRRLAVCPHDMTFCLYKFLTPVLTRS